MPYRMAHDMPLLTTALLGYKIDWVPQVVGAQWLLPNQQI